MKIIQNYIESELSSICGRILRFLDSHLIPLAAALDSKVCFLKMKGKHLCYLEDAAICSSLSFAGCQTLLRTFWLCYICSLGENGLDAEILLTTSLLWPPLQLPTICREEKEKNRSYKDEASYSRNPIQDVDLLGSNTTIGAKAAERCLDLLN
ncbi:14-3-3-like protein GF14 kappa [Nymphaea thermarum]|nr:14-3-3-like protein GF14 kappa [Nymphaea thermarum]